MPILSLKGTLAVNTLVGHGHFKLIEAEKLI